MEAGGQEVTGLGPRPSPPPGLFSPTLGCRGSVDWLSVYDVCSATREVDRGPADTRRDGTLGSEALCALLQSRQLHSCTQTQAGGLHGTTDAVNHLDIIQVVLRAPSSLPVILVLQASGQLLGTFCSCTSWRTSTCQDGIVLDCETRVQCWFPEQQFMMSLTVSCWSHSPGCNLLAHPWCPLIQGSQQSLPWSRSASTVA